MLKIVIDANVFIRGLLKSKYDRLLIESFVKETVLLVTSEYMVEELSHALRKPKFVELIDEADAALLIALIREKTMVVKPKHKINICRDKKDNPIIEAAIQARANFIITNDNDLLVLDSFENIPICTPAQFLKAIQEA